MDDVVPAQRLFEEPEPSQLETRSALTRDAKDLVDRVAVGTRLERDAPAVDAELALGSREPGRMAPHGVRHMQDA